MARRYVRDARGRFASKGYSGQTGGRGSRLGAPGKAQKPGKQIKVQSAGGKLRKPPSKPKAAVQVPGAASSIKATGRLPRPQAQNQRTATGGKFGPRNSIKEGPKSPQTKMNKAVDNIAGAIKDMKPQMDKLKKVRKEADALKKKIVDGMRGDAEKAYKKPSITDKRSRDYFGKLTKEGKGQDPSTGGKKKRKPRKPKK